MENCFDREEDDFIVLVNQEDQYSLWPAWKEVPGGWHDKGITGKKQVCLDYIEQHWTDMRPRSLKEWMADNDS